ncbi:hypothetical protein BC936DRAFT_143523 [Jimgerdemannia flammicorona]|uniref:Uncharacterized protein n=1 Tax=Jimgerdemannia flammicorona TaxID=994334 RepID=A0A433DDP9_9FUNG|nr:hypothetical protein BC936DRAFT_143523 [Jimgerdemannia flammicorona]
MAEGLNDDSLVGVLGMDRENDLSNVDMCNSTLGLAKSPMHTSLQPISASTGQHLIDTDDVEGMHANTHVEEILARDLGDVFVAANAASFKGLRRNLLVLIRD